MPVYEYECNECKKTFEVQQRMADDPLTDCPECDGTLKKLMSMSSFHLKGGGWYADGYASKKSSDPKKTTKSETASPPCKAQKSSECKNCPAASAG